MTETTTIQIGRKADRVLTLLPVGSSLELVGALEGFRLRRRDVFGIFEMVPPLPETVAIFRLSWSQARDTVRLYHL